ncbi:MAG: hypothetical protein KAR06_10685 [Deltaproteobacteria bacterium]|nr:hypothetical protein [Deltaproteobacteria bacterium]
MLFSVMHLIHLIFVILWIGGLAFITMLVLPAVIRTPDSLEKVLQFQRIEHRFAPIARVYSAIVGISGFVMMFMMGWQGVIFTAAGLPLLFMTLVWCFWTVMLFGLEPIIIKKMLDNMAKDPDEMTINSVFKRMNVLHWVLLFVSLLASAAGAVFAHGFFL